MAKSKPKSPMIARSEDVINETIRQAIPANGVFWDYLTTIRLDANFGADEWERGKIEGMREFAGVLQDRASGLFDKQKGD